MNMEVAVCLRCAKAPPSLGYEVLCADCTALYAAEDKADENRGRRERIATAVLAGFASSDPPDADDMSATYAAEAVHWADALIEELDK